MSNAKNDLLQLLLAKSIKTGHFILVSGKEIRLHSRALLAYW